jgi:hypothetical protein
MITFDEILPRLSELFREKQPELEQIGRMLINRDLNGRVRLVVGEAVQENKEALAALNSIAGSVSQALAPHAYSPERMVLFEQNLDATLYGLPSFPLAGVSNIDIVDRMATETNWATITPETSRTPRVVFFSMKGGVGRSTALAATAWALAQKGKKVLVLDLDLESPGLSSALLPSDKRPQFGITDWLVEDLVDNGDVVFRGMVSTSGLSHDGEIYVVPAHGREAGEYVSKLGRVWMPKVNAKGEREPWSARLNRLLGSLEERWSPNVILIDSRAGIDEVASACVTDIDASLVLMFAIDGEQTWSGYRSLFHHWGMTGMAQEIRERLQLVGAMIPEVESQAYFQKLLEHSWDTFTEWMYDAVPAGIEDADLWNFDQSDESAPHYPWSIRWHRGFAALQSIHAKLNEVAPVEVESVFGPLVNGIAAIVEQFKQQNG